MADSLGAIPGRLPKFFSADPKETVFMRFAEGVGEVRPDGKGLNVNLRVFTPDGDVDGTEMCSGEVRGNLEDFHNPPRTPRVRPNDPGPIAEVPVTSLCQAKWTFADGATLTAIGKGTSRIVSTQGRGGIMADAVAMHITEGTGRFAGARGGVTIDTTVALDDVDAPPVGHAGAKIIQKSIQVFRVVTP